MITAATRHLILKSPIAKCRFIGMRLSNFSDFKKEHKHDRESGLSPEILQNKTQVSSEAKTIETQKEIKRMILKNFKSVKSQ